MSQFAGLHRFARRIARIDERLRTPRDFFVTRAETYHDVASRIARATLSALKPPATSAEDWTAEMEGLVASITAELLDPAGLALRIGSRQRTMREVSSSDGVIFDLEEIRKWVLAGIRREPDAKIIDEDDAEILRKYGEASGSRIIAARVRRAYYSGNREGSYERMREALRNYIGGPTNAERADETLLAVVAAWEAAFVPMVRSDLAEWMRDVAREELG
jgi:hypothetical protein